ncbi:MAG: hypothetical protein WC623_21665 [Pedobacter sp.]|uniref:hypothetical protein n=1 Tax=Pedobacter sp. TaxID=1411316 RepID=UPI0035645C87
MEPKQPIWIMFIAIIATIYLALITIPISDKTNDVYLDMTITKPINVVIPQPLEFSDVTATVKRSTFLESPNLGCLIGCSGTIKLTASTPSVTTTKNLDPIYITSSVSTRIVLKKVPLTEKTVTLKLFENNVVTSTKEVIIP